MDLALKVAAQEESMGFWDPCLAAAPSYGRA